MRINRLAAGGNVRGFVCFLRFCCLLRDEEMKDKKPYGWHGMDDRPSVSNGWEPIIAVLFWVVFVYFVTS